MKVEFTDSLGNATTTISIQKVVATNGPAVRSICINCGYELKDKAKEWAKKHGGSWHPVLKVWYVPLDGSKSQAIEVTKELEEFGLIKKYCYIFLDSRADEKYNESLKKFFLEVFPGEQTPPMGTVYDIHDVYPGDKEYISDPLYYIKEVGEIEQPQGYIDFKQKKHFRVLISYNEQITPEDEMEMAWGTYWREFNLENGDKVWCFPHSNPNIRFDNGEPWPDYVFEDDIYIEKPVKSADIKISLLSNKETKKPTGFSFETIVKGDENRWNACYYIGKRYGSWNADQKYWSMSIYNQDEVKIRAIIKILNELREGKGSGPRISGDNGLLAEFTEKADDYLDKLLAKYSGVASNG